MADITNHVRVAITRNSTGPSRAGFGVLMYLSALADWVTDRIRFYTSLAGAAVDFPVTTSPEYLFAQAAFSQNPRPRRIAIGRTATARRPTQKYLLEVLAVRNSYAYLVNVAGKGFTAASLSFTSDGTATNDEIVAGLVSALNGVASKNYTAAAVGAGGSQDVEITGNAAGDWFCVEVVNLADLKIAQTHADPGVATDLAEILTVSKDWYALVTGYNSNAVVLAAAGWIEANDRIYLPDVNETEAVTTATGNSDTIDDLKGLAYERTMGMYHHKLVQMPAAAWLGRVLPKDPGSVTFALKELAGVTATTLTETQRSNLTGKRGNGYEDVGGVGVTFRGMRADGDFLDVTRDLDKLTDDMRVDVFSLLSGNDKVPYTSEGISMVKAPILGALRRAVKDGILADTPEPTVTVPEIADVDAADKADRILDDVSWSGTLASSIHETDIDGTVSL